MQSTDKLTTLAELRDRASQILYTISGCAISIKCDDNEEDDNNDVTFESENEEGFYAILYDNKNENDDDTTMKQNDEDNSFFDDDDSNIDDDFKNRKIQSENVDDETFLDADINADKGEANTADIISYNNNANSSAKKRKYISDLKMKEEQRNLLYELRNKHLRRKMAFSNYITKAYTSTKNRKIQFDKLLHRRRSYYKAKKEQVDVTTNANVTTIANLTTNVTTNANENVQTCVRTKKFMEMVHYIRNELGLFEVTVNETIRNAVIHLGFADDIVFKKLQLMHDKIKYIYLNLVGSSNMINLLD